MGMLSIPKDFPAFRLHTASSATSLSTGRLSASCVWVWLLWSWLVSGWSSQVYRPLQYSVHLFRTAELSVRMFPLLSSMTADLCCWVLVRVLRVLYASLLFPVIIPFSTFLHCSSIHFSSTALIFFLTSLFTFLSSSPASVLVYFCCVSCHLWSHRSRISLVI